MRAKVEPLAVVDFGGQYTHLINRTIRESGVAAGVRTVDELVAGLLDGCPGMVLSGGPDSVVGASLDDVAHVLRAFARPLLGICFGHQLLAVVFGGRVEGACAREYGLATIAADPEAALFRGLPSRQVVWMSHGDHVAWLPAGFRATASTDSLPIAAFESEDGRIHGVQFHPEVVHTEHGRAMLANFVRLCAAHEPAGLSTMAWSAERMRDEILASIAREAGDRTLVLLLSGGVDSLVALALCEAAVGAHRVRAFHVDTGFMRKGESRQIAADLARAGFGGVRIVDASDRFFASLAGVVDPERKRATIGRLFVEVFQDEVRGLGDDWVLVQGTIYPDRIETAGTARADRIKTHHNRVEEIEALRAQGRVIEPLAELYKHEVRQVGALLGLPSPLLNRQPFPGPGLAIRIVCADSAVPPAGFDAEAEALEALVGGFGFEGSILPVRSVGVQGDARTYRHPAVVWPSGAFRWKDVKAAASRAINRLGTVNRVVAALRRPERLSLGVCLLDRERVRLLQEVDAVAREATQGMEGIWQMPVVALPLFDRAGRQAFVLRPVSSRDAMTADVFEMAPDTLRALVHRLGLIPGVGEVFYDVTTKPPGTIEWE